MTRRYAINEVFYSLQGEGGRAGEASVFVRMQACNMRCDVEEGPLSPGGFRCDTEFESGRLLTADEIAREIGETGHELARWVVLTGGEPGLQVDEELISRLHVEGLRIAIETNGSVELPAGVDWVCVSPKVAEHAIRQLTADEVKYVRGYGQAIPRTRVDAPFKWISPAFDGGRIDKRTLDWCIRLCLENPEWRLSVQQHQLWRIR